MVWMRLSLFILWVAMSGGLAAQRAVEYYDAQWRSVNKGQATFYREITYDKAGRPIEMVRDYWMTGELQFEGRILALNPDTLDGVCIWYYKNGQKEQEAVFKKGEIIGEPRIWSVEGREEGVLDKQEHFYSEGYLDTQLQRISHVINKKIEKDSAGIFTCLGLGISAFKQGNYTDGLKLCQIAHDISKLISNGIFLSLCQKNIGTIYHYQGKYTEALIFYEKALLLIKNLKLKKEIAGIYNNMGETYRMINNFDQAIQYFTRALNFRKQSGQETAYANTLSNLGLVYFDRNNYNQAMSCFKRALEICIKKGDLILLANNYSNIGSVLDATGQWLEAIGYYQKAKKIYEENLIYDKLATVLSNIGETYRNIGNMARAIEYYTESLSIKQERNLKKEMAITLNNMGFAFKEQGLFNEALIKYFSALQIQKEFNLTSSIASTYINIAGVYQRQGDYNRAIDFINQALVIFQESGNFAEIARAHSNLGVIYCDQGLYRDAMLLQEKARAVFERLDLKLELAKVFINISAICRNQGQFTKSLAFLDKANEINKNIDGEIELADIYLNLGSTYHSLKKLDKALEYYSKAMSIQKKLSRLAGLVYTSSNIGTIYLEKKQYEEAKIHFTESAKLAKELGLNANLASTLINIGSLHQETGQLDTACVYFYRARDIQQQMGANVDLAKNYLNLGGLYISDRQDSLALLFFHKARDIQEKIGLDLDLGRYTYSSLCLIKLKQLQLDSALFYASKNIKINEKIRGLTMSWSDRSKTVENILNSLEIGVVSAALTGKDTLAFYFSEQVKGRSFSDLLAEKANRKSSLGEPFQSKLQDVNNQIAAINLSLSKNILEPGRGNLIQLRDSLYEFKLGIEDQIRETAPSYASLVYPQPAQLETIQEALAETELLVSYFFGNYKAYAFVLTKREFQMVDLGDDNSIRHLLMLFQTDFIQLQRSNLARFSLLTKKRIESNFSKIAFNLYQKLWAPLEQTSLLTGKDILIIPDEALHYLPFELILKDSLPKPYSDCNFLIKSYNINYYPSATLFSINRTHQEKANKQSMDFFGIAPIDFKNVNCSDDSLSFSSLPNAVAEIRSIGLLFPPSKQLLLIDKKASESTLKSSTLSFFRYLHFSTHAIINLQNPDFSRLLLHANDLEDGCLNLYEFFDLHLNADLVSLSACETGLGRLVRGEGMVGFTRALMYAGTPSVIPSLWKVADESTKQLFINYYTDLVNDGYDKYTPLRNAQLKMIKEGGEYANPFYWAPFVFTGERYSKY